MAYRLLLLTVLFLLSVSSVSFADESTDLARYVETGYRRLVDLQASFTQTTKIASLGRKESGKGTMILKPGKGEPKFRFDYTKPKQSIINDGKNVWYYQPELKQVIKLKSSVFLSGERSIAMSYLTGMGNLMSDFTPKSAGKNKGGDYLLDLTPKSKSQMLKKIQLTVSKDYVARVKDNPEAYNAGFPVAASVIVDQSGNSTEIVYQNVKTNKGVADSRFRFSKPEGVKVIEQ